MRTRRHLLAAAVALAAALPVSFAAPAATGTEKTVYLIPIRGMIEPALLYVIRRGVAEAERTRADAIVFVMDTPGGTVDAARDIVNTIQHIQVPTCTFVEKDAFSAGAIIALATKRIYMAPGSVIGDAMPILMSPFGGIQELSAGVEEKTVAAVAALIRAAAEQGGHRTDVAEAMVRREKGLKIGDEVISPPGQLLTLTNREAERLVGPDARPLLSSGTMPDVAEVLRAIGMPDARVRELRVTSSERVARWIAALGPLFLIAGLLGIYIEIKTPGFGLPGILGILSLAVFFWGHHIAGLAGSEDILIFAMGFVLLLVELLFIPGFGAVGLAGIALMILGLLLGMTERYPGGPWLPSWSALAVPMRNLSLSLVGSVVGAVLLARFLPRTPFYHRLVLEASTNRLTGYASAKPRPGLVGLSGRTLSALRPSGTAEFAGRRLDVLTEGGYVEADRPVRIVAVEGSRVVVEAVPGAAETGRTPS